MTAHTIADGVRKEVARSRKLPITGKRSARPAGRPGDFLIAKESLQRSLPRHFLMAALPNQYSGASVCVFKAGRNLSVRCGLKPNQRQNQILGRDQPPPAGRPRAQVKERVGRTTPFSSSAMSSGTGYSLIGLLASRARLRFTGTARINAGRRGENELSSSGNSVFSPVSHEWGSPQNPCSSALICGQRS